MSRPPFLSLIALLFSLPAGVAAEDAWKTKDSSQWSEQDINQILNDSPWAKQVSVLLGVRGGEGSPGGRGRMAGPGGVAFPGGGYPGGGGYPRGGAGYPSGDEYPRGGSRGGGEGGASSFTVTIRWRSALPVKQAQERSGQTVQPSEKSQKAEAEETGQEYVIAVMGLPVGGPVRRNRRREPESDDGDNSESARQLRRDPETVREELMERSQLVRKGKQALAPLDVKISPPDAPGEIRFVFPAREPIGLDDKEVSFDAQLGQIRIEKKFKLKDMVYKGKLEL
jgi:hypothetical protein